MRIKLPFGSTAENNQLTLPSGFLTADLERKAIRLHDGVTPGGLELLAKQEIVLTGENWGLVNVGTTYICRAVVRGSDRWAIPRTQSGGQYRGLTQGDEDTSWTQLDFFASNDIASIAYGNGMYVAIGTSGHTRSSPDCVTWTTRTNTTFASNTVRFINGFFYATGGNTCVSRSADGITWSLITQTVNTGRGIAYGNGTFLIVNNQRQIRRSVDGATWTNGTNVTTAGTPSSLAFGNGLFVVTFTSGAIFTSPDGLTWTSRNPNPASTASIQLNEVTFGYGLFVAVGNAGFLMTSPDGINWTQRVTDLTATQHLYGVAMGDGTCYAVGVAGRVLKALG